jgi:hypothetical protein
LLNIYMSYAIGYQPPRLASGWLFYPPWQKHHLLCHGMRKGLPATEDEKTGILIAPRFYPWGCIEGKIGGAPRDRQL